MEPLVIVFVWNNEDEHCIKKYIDYISSKLANDVDNPFSRTLNIPIFYFFNQKKDGIPPDFYFDAERVIVFPFIGTNSVIHGDWKAYLNGMAKANNTNLVPIALDNTAFNIGDISKINFIRFYEYEERKEQRLFLAVAHEIYRSGFNYKNDYISGTDAALKIFLSHAKDDSRGSRGINFAKELKSEINNSTMKYFFDTTDIAPGYDFSEEISKNIENSTMLLINSDIYSSRYWCQREVQLSKEFECPIVEVDLIMEGIDRKFPYAGNVPVVRVDVLDSKPEKDDLLRVLEYTLLETIRFYHATKNLNKVNSSAKKMYRPPEMIDLPKVIRKNNNTGNIELLYKEIVYPDPPLYSEEIDFFDKLGIRVYTPACNLKDELLNKNIGISISNPSKIELDSLGMNNKHIEKLSQMVAKYILSSGGRIIYGGDLRENGFTRLLVDEAAILMDRLQTKEIHIENYVSFPIYNSNEEEFKNFSAKYSNFLKMVKVGIDDSIEHMISDESDFIIPDTRKNKFIWAKSLTKMRKEMISKCDIRICAGGAKTGYKGALPGVLEEIIIAQKNELPIYLIGGFGGISKDICQLIQGFETPQELTVDWQCCNNLGYFEVLSSYEEIGEDICYDKIVDALRSLELNNGLSTKENRLLFDSTYIDEIIELIMKGIKKIS